MTRLGATMLLLTCVGATWAAGPPDAVTWARFGKIEEVTRLNLRGISLFQEGDFSGATKTFTKVVEIRKGLYSKDRYPQGHPAVAQSLSNLATLYQAQGEYEMAAPLSERVVEMNEGCTPRHAIHRATPTLPAV